MVKIKTFFTLFAIAVIIFCVAVNFQERYKINEVFNLKYSDELHDLLLQEVYLDYSEKYKDDEFTIMIYLKCKNKILVEEKVSCVVETVGDYYVYDYDRAESINTLGVEEFLSPSELKEKGGICKDVYLVYNIVFNKMGFKTKLNLLNMGTDDAHVNNIIYTNDSEKTCIVDGYTWGCI